MRVVRVPVLFRRQLAVANFPSMLAYLPMAAWRAARMRGSSAFDVVNTHFVVPTGPLGHWIADRYGIPNVLSVHGGDLYDPSKQLSPHRHGWLREPIRRMLQRADAVVAQSNNTLGNVSDIYGVRRDVDLIPLGIERPPANVAASRADFGLPADAFVLVTVGRLVARKQTTQLVAALAKSGVERAHLLVVGSGPDEAPIRAGARPRIGVADRVHLLGQPRRSRQVPRHRRRRRLRLHQPARRLRPRVPGSDGHGPAGHLLRPRRPDRLSLRPAPPASCCT